MTFDLDLEAGLGFAAVKATALLGRDGLANIDLIAFTVLSGGKGLHVVMLVAGAAGRATVRAFAGRFAKAMAQAHPGRSAADMRKAGRRGRIFLDRRRNQRGSTAIVPCPGRARPGAPVGREEVDGIDTPASYTIHDAADPIACGRPLTGGVSPASHRRPRNRGHPANPRATDTQPWRCLITTNGRQKMRRLATLGLLATAVLTAGCTKDMGGDTSAGAGRPAPATATLTSPTGVVMGDATIIRTASGLRLVANGMGLPPGEHGVHIHAVGRCEAPDFTSAGPHWNPTAMKHGKDAPSGPHYGDAPNLIVGADGKGRIEATLPGTLSGTPESLMDADGAAVVIHAAADDYKTDPSGNSGGRIACGVVTAG